MGRYLLVLAICAIVVACGRNTAPAGAHDPHAIVNGIETTAYPAVVRIRVGFSTCTGTAVSRTTLITAAHCTAAGNPTYNGVAAKETRSSRVGTDLAVAVFPENTLPAEYARLVDRAPAHNDVIEIVGYGQTDFINNNATDGKKRYGRNRLMGFAELAPTEITHHRLPKGDYLHFRSPISITGLAPGANAMTGRGDSGGPVFIRGMLAGAVSMGGTRAGLTRTRKLTGEPSPDDKALYEYDTNLFSAASIALMKKAVDEIDADIAGFDALKRLHSRTR